MVLRFVCKRCSAVLYEGPKIRTPQEVAADLGGKCPSCKRELDYGPGTFRVERVAIAVRPSKPPKPQKRTLLEKLSIPS